MKNHIKQIASVTLLAASVAVVFLFSENSKAVSSQKETFRWPVMGTIAQISVRGDAGQISFAETNLLPCVQSTYRELENLLSAWDEDSELCRLSKSGCTNWVESVSDVVKPCYSSALKLMHQSGGAFNPYVGSKLREMGVSDGRSYCNFDLGAIAKGFAVDVAAQRISKQVSNDNVSILVDLGGNLRVVGEGEWRTGVRNPFDKSAPFVGIIALTNGESVATSGNYERFIEKDGVRYSHILDGRTCEPTSGIAAVTVVTPGEYGAVLADGLSTTLFVLGPESGTKFLRQHYPLAQALWIPDTPGKLQIIVNEKMHERLMSPLAEPVLER